MNQNNLLCIVLGILLLVLVVWLIYNQINEHYLQDDPKLNELRNIFNGFFSQDRYWSGPLDMLNNRDMVKEISLYKGDKSYTLNKQKIFLCLRDEDKKYYSTNLLIYVLAHEYSHALCKSIGHTEEFHRIFESLLVELTDQNIYDPSIPIRQDYCVHGDN